MEREPVVEALAHERDERRRGLRRVLDVELHRERAARRLDRGHVGLARVELELGLGQLGLGRALDLVDVLAALGGLGLARRGLVLRTRRRAASAAGHGEDGDREREEAAHRPEGRRRDGQDDESRSSVLSTCGASGSSSTPRRAAAARRASCPSVERALTTRGLSHRVDRTTGIDHARELAADAAAEGEIAAACGGDGLVGAVAGGLRRHRGRARRSSRAGGATTWPACSASPTIPAAAVDVLADGEPQPLDLAQVGDRVFCCIGSCGFDSDANRIANETTRLRATRSTSTRRCAPWPAGGRRASSSCSTASRRRSPAGPWPWPTPRPTAAGCSSPPAPRSTDGRLDVVTIAEASKAAFLAPAAQGLQGHARRRGRGHRPPGAGSPASTPTAPSPSTPTATRSPRCPLTVRALPAAARVLLPVGQTAP